MIVNLKLSVETAKRLSDKAGREGQTLEGLLENLAEHEAEVSGNGKSADAEPQESEERPWRGVFVLDYPREQIFTLGHEINVNALPPLPAEVRIDARRMADESNDPWYDVVGADSPLDQGDLILRCPILIWDSSKQISISKEGDEERLQENIASYRADVIVLTQACDLEHQKVRNVVLSPHRPISEIRVAWDARMRQMGQAPSPKAWRRYCEDIVDGYVWNQVFLNDFKSTEFSTELRLVDFHDLFTVPREFLESLLRKRQAPRLRLRPPYREHISQAFARFFMRVGLPQPVSPAW